MVGRVLPFETKLVGEVVHLGESVAYCYGAEGWHQDAMGDLPSLLAIVGCEQSISGARSQLFDPARNSLVKARLIAKLVDDLLRTSHEFGLAVECYLKERA